MPGVNGDGERGALGVALNPGWPHPHVVYVYVTRSTVERPAEPDREVTRANGHARMRVLISQPASSSPYHNGGRILFGPDGKLYAIVGDGHDSANAQDLVRNLRGKILRMTRTAAVPSDNPIAGSRCSRSASATRTGSRSTRRPAACGRRRTVPSATTR